MKIKKLLEMLGIKEEILFFYLKLREMYFKIFISSNMAKEKYIQKKFKKNVGYDIDFSKDPQTFNEKIQFRKLYDNNPLYSICADKYRVREYVKEKIGEEYLIPLLLVTDRLTEEQWEKLPNQFVAKANHNSGPVQIVKDKSKADKKKIIKELNNQLKLDYGVLSQEKYYSDIPRKIIVEKYLEHEGETLQDYKYHSFGDELYIENITLRKKGYIESNFYDVEWNPLNFSIGTVIDIQKREKPENFDLMTRLAKKLSEDFDYVRVDLYNINGKIYFGELTFCGDSGLGKFTDEKWNIKFGSYWKQKKLK